MVWVTFLKHKSEAFERFKIFRKIVERETDLKLKCLRSDRGGEFTSQEFIEYCERRGIKRQYSTARTPQQNGVVERKNRTVKEMARTMLNEAKLPDKFWKEAVHTAVYILNRAQIRIRTAYTPYELWYGKTTNVKNFKIFGCKCFIRKNDDSLENFNSRSDEGIFLGYSTHSKAYKCYNKRLNKIVEAINVMFDDTSVCCNDKEEYESLSFQESESFHNENHEQDKVETDDEDELAGRIESENSPNSKITSDGSKIKTSSRIIAKRHPESQVIGDIDKGILTRRKAKIGEQVNIAEQFCLIADFEPKNVTEALSNSSWQNAMLDEINQIEKNKTWELVPRLDDKNIIEGFKSSDKPDYVLRLKKALYGLKQAPRAWYSRLDKHLIANGFIKGNVDSTLYTKMDNENLLAVEIYVDDIIFGSTNDHLAQTFSGIMESEFEMSMLGPLTFFLGIQVSQLEHVGTPMETGCKLMKIDESPLVDQREYRSMIGSLLYLTACRPDIMYSVCQVARYQAAPRQSHLNVVHRIFKYLQGTLDYGLWYPKNDDFALIGYTDANWGGCKDDQRSTSGAAFFLGDRLVAWHSKKQDCVTLSTAESEVIAATTCCTQLIWMSYQLSDLGIHYIREHVSSNEVILIHVPSKLQVADIFTKALPRELFSGVLSGFSGVLSGVLIWYRFIQFQFSGVLIGTGSYRLIWHRFTVHYLIYDQRYFSSFYVMVKIFASKMGEIVNYLHYLSSGKYVACVVGKMLHVALT
ncbi:uncharacterized protein LOC131067604 [Cryptomeria japonica]|uniref:uncharacterized protein LOC131067604 n=1 Tax=Cryptomeria japonica TaxID=3369 RepID=UPI0027DA71F4|nr:uncharacterized protein LOC131067604 [Cryptomeria japonica]